jgi:hypothetical protein
MRLLRFQKVGGPRQFSESPSLIGKIHLRVVKTASRQHSLFGRDASLPGFFGSGGFSFAALLSFDALALLGCLA